MSAQLIKEARKVINGKVTRLDDEELEYLAQQIAKLGFKIGFARAYAAGPTIIKDLVRALEIKEKKLAEIEKIARG